MYDHKMVQVMFRLQRVLDEPVHRENPEWSRRTSGVAVSTITVKIDGDPLRDPLGDTLHVMLEVAGVYRKKDGTPGVQPYSERFYYFRGKVAEQIGPEEKQVARDAIDEFNRLFAPIGLTATYPSWAVE